jgi:hypothetical protein
MKCVHLWKCDCGARLKVIAETGTQYAQGHREEVACPKCQKPSLVDGHVREIFVEDQDALWAKSESVPRQ